MHKYFKTSVFLLLTAVFLTVACKPNVNTGNQSADPVKYKVTFAVEGGGGQLRLLNRS